MALNVGHFRRRGAGVPTKHASLGHLTRGKHLDNVVAYDLDVDDRRVREELVEFLAGHAPAQRRAGDRVAEDAALPFPCIFSVYMRVAHREMDSAQDTSGFREANSQ